MFKDVYRHSLGESRGKIGYECGKVVYATHTPTKVPTHTQTHTISNPANELPCSY